MSMMSQSFQRLAVVALIGLGLAGCSRSETYRYKLTLAVNTADGVKRGSSVVEVLFYQVSFPERGTMHKLRGEALYLDLGPGARASDCVVNALPAERRCRAPLDA
jgi:hypothetical protein